MMERLIGDLILLALAGGAIALAWWRYRRALEDLARQRQHATGQRHLYLVWREKELAARRKANEYRPSPFLSWLYADIRELFAPFRWLAVQLSWRDRRR